MNDFKILHIDDEAWVIERMKKKLSSFDLPMTVVGASSGDAAIKILENDPEFSVLIIDMFLGSEECTTILPKLNSLCPNAKKYINSNDSTHASMRKVMSKVEDYFDKNNSENETDLVLKVVQDYQEFLKEKRRNNIVNRVAMSSMRDANIKTRSPLMLDEIVNAKKYSETDFPVLITGETGVGKELFSKMIASEYKSDKFLAINCASFVGSEDRLESELFGHVKGSFTGAISDKKGLFECGSGGVILLDEIDTLSHVGQTKLLRVLEEKKFRKVGGTDLIQFNAKFIFTAKPGIEDKAERGEFLNDLLGRIDVLRLRIPPLRHRPEDIPLLLKHFGEKLKNSTNGVAKQFTSDAIEVLMEMEWPRNVRSLENFYSRIATVCDSEKINSKDIVRIYGEQKRVEPKAAIEPRDKVHWRKIASDPQLLKAELDKHRGNQASLARQFGIPRNTIQHWLKKHKLTKKDIIDGRSAI